MVKEEEEGLKFSSHEEILALPLWNPRTVWVGRDLKSTSSHGQGHSHQDRITCTGPSLSPAPLPVPPWDTGRTGIHHSKAPAGAVAFPPELTPAKASPEAVPARCSTRPDGSCCSRVPGLGNAFPGAAAAQ